MTAICLSVCTWVAASPAPSYSRMVSTMSSMSRCTAAVRSDAGSTRSATFRSTGCPRRATFKIAISRESYHGARLALRRQRAPDLLGRQRHVQVRDTEGRQRVDDGVQHRRRDADRARLADALDAQRIVRRERVGVADL